MGDVIGPFEYRFAPRSRAAVRVARNVASEWLRSQPAVNRDGVDDLLVAVAELCTNAVQHGFDGSGSVAVRGHVHRDAVVIEVEDGGPGFDPPEDLDGTSADVRAEYGRGLHIVRSLVDEVAFERTSNGMVVRCRKDGMLRHPGDAASEGLSDRFQRS